MTMTGIVPELIPLARALEEGLPIAREPFHDVARGLGRPETWVVENARAMIDSGYIRHFGAFFDYRALGLRGYLFGADLPPDCKKSVISRLTGMSGVTHLYGRRHYLGTWFTALLAGEACALDLCGFLRSAGCRFVALETALRIKLRPVFAERGGIGPETNPPGSPLVGGRLEGRLLEIARALQGGMGVSSRPFDRAGDISGIGWHELLDGAKSLAGLGILRKIGASLNHIRAGWTSNSLCAFDASGIGDDEAAELARRAVSNLPWASHCYLRRVFDSDLSRGWPYNLYIMIHATSEGELGGRERTLRDKLPGFGFTSLRTEEEHLKRLFRI
jgi:DNA-binding Lrp family transcriptional regulator